MISMYYSINSHLHTIYMYNLKFCLRKYPTNPLCNVSLLEKKFTSKNCLKPSNFERKNFDKNWKIISFKNVHKNEDADSLDLSTTDLHS